MHREFVYVEHIFFSQERKSIRPEFSAEGIYGGTLLVVQSNKFIYF
jgi:hypothetical protein